MGYKRIFKGKPYTFHEFVFFSPAQFDSKEELEDRDFICRIKICVNSNRVFTGPLIGECIGEFEMTNKELKQLLDLVYNTPGLIIYGREYTINDDYNALWRYYGTEKDRPLAFIDNKCASGETGETQGT